MKIILDECLTKGRSESIIQSIALDDPSIEVTFLLDYLKRVGLSSEAIAKGIKDPFWADRLSDEGGWFVISADRGKHTRVVEGPPLTKILKTRKITAAYLSGSIQNGSGFGKARAVIASWPQIKRLFQTKPAGTRINIRLAPSGNAFIVEVLA
jgi:hypothetical protein